MDLGIKGKKALVSASSDGIGLAIAKALSQEGANVYINGRSNEKVREAIKKIRQEGGIGELWPAVYDLSTPAGAEDLIRHIPHVDILVNNLGIYEVKPFEEITDEDWLKFFNINVLSGVRLSRFYFPKMKETSWGRIIFISSESGLQIPVEMIHYGVTKTAQIAVARGLAEMTIGTGITVNSVLPGPTNTSGVKKFISEVAESKGITPEEVEKEFFENQRPSSLLKRFAEIEEVGEVTAFLCSEKASAINGTAIRVEGGIVRSIG
ncbi:MAG: SDR family oxidoreductase [Candidatus Protochlamydia sp.]|nr:SDR family oxidoreductase [Candidatus Protochlamydia sp.]